MQVYLLVERKIDDCGSDETFSEGEETSEPDPYDNDILTPGDSRTSKSVKTSDWHTPSRGHGVHSLKRKGTNHFYGRKGKERCSASHTRPTISSCSHRQEGNSEENPLSFHTPVGQSKTCHESRMTSPNLTPVLRQRSHQGRTHEENSLNSEEHSYQGKSHKENQDLCPVRTHKASSSAEATANVASVLGELTNTLKQIVNWLDKQETRLTSMEKILSASPTSCSSSGASQKPKVPLAVRVCL